MNRPTGLTNWVLTPHAESVMRRRGIGVEVVTQVVTAPDQRYPDRPRRDVLQRRMNLGDPAGEYLVRVFVDVDRTPAVVVTVYRTSKINKYWRAES